jgi:taurine dehydrogenase small subunit
MKTSEEQLIERYFDAFNRHDIDGVMACFHTDAVVGDSGTRAEGHDAVRLYYERQFAVVPDGRCDLQTCVGRDGRGVAESLFHGTTRDGNAVKAVGAEVIEFADGKIREIRDYHRPVGAP